MDNEVWEESPKEATIEIVASMGGRHVTEGGAIREEKS